MMVTVISAAFRFEMSCGLLDGRPELPQHVGDDMIGSYQQAFIIDLERDMAVAYVPSETSEVHRIAGGDDFSWSIEVPANGVASITTQASAKIYRALGYNVHSANLIVQENDD